MQDICFGIPASVSAGFHKLDLAYGWTISPHSLGRSNDRRLLAVRFRRLWVTTSNGGFDVEKAGVRRPDSAPTLPAGEDDTPL